MGILSSLIGGGVSEAAKGIGEVVDRFVETPDEERDYEKFKIETQTAINAIEAANSNFFVSGARPAALWVCVAIFAYHFLIQDIIIFLLTLAMIAFGADAILFNEIISIMPKLDIDTMLYVMGGLLGLGGLRTVEKIKSVARN